MSSLDHFHRRCIAFGVLIPAGDAGNSRGQRPRYAPHNRESTPQGSNSRAPGQGQKLFGLPVFGLIGYVIAGLFGIWILIGILRSGQL